VLRAFALIGQCERSCPDGRADRATTAPRAARREPRGWAGPPPVLLPSPCRARVRESLPALDWGASARAAE
jgi:hypothetical protein